MYGTEYAYACPVIVPTAHGLLSLFDILSCISLDITYGVVARMVDGRYAGFYIHFSAQTDCTDCICIREIICNQVSGANHELECF